MGTLDGTATANCYGVVSQKASQDMRPFPIHCAFPI
jgi:hypothetical protein